MSEHGLPVMDDMGGMWIKLTICGVTRLGYGHAGSKTGGDAIKEVIGDALRNAAMRFGAALDLWHKGDLHGDGEDDQGQRESEKRPKAGVKGAGKDSPANGGPADMSPKARAQRITTGVAGGDAAGAALAISGWDQDLINKVWEHLDLDTRAKLEKAWPETTETA